jgi:hypothetical protein
VFLDHRLKQQIPELRRRYKEIFLIDLSGQPGELNVPNLLIRALTRQEFLFLQQDIEIGCDPTEQILQSCIIWPELNWNDIDKNTLFDLPYMCFDELGKCIIDVSGFGSNEDIATCFNNARIAINSLDSVMLTVISRHFHSLKPIELEDMTLAELTRLFAIAETSLENPIDLRLFLDEPYAEKQMALTERKRRKAAARLPNGMMPDIPMIPGVPEGWDSAESRE